MIYSCPRETRILVRTVQCVFENRWVNRVGTIGKKNPWYHWLKPNFPADFNICFTGLIGFSYPCSIRNVVRYAWDTADRNTLPHAAEELIAVRSATVCLQILTGGYSIGCDIEIVAIRPGFVQVWFMSVVWNAANDSQDLWQNRIYPHVDKEYVEETTPPLIFYVFVVPGNAYSVVTAYRFPHLECRRTYWSITSDVYRWRAFAMFLFVARLNIQ